MKKKRKIKKLRAQKKELKQRCMELEKVVFDALTATIAEGLSTSGIDLALHFKKAVDRVYNGPKGEADNGKSEKTGQKHPAP